MDLKSIWLNYKGRILGTIIGIILALSFLVLGFWRTVFWVILALLGLFVGSFIDKRKTLEDFWDRVRELLFIGRER